MNRMVAFVAVAALLLLGSWALAEPTDQMVPDPGIPDTLRVANVTANAGQKAIVDVNFYNDEELGGLTMPLKWSSPSITLDSVSFVGSRVNYLTIKPITIDNPNQQVKIGAVVLFETYIPTGTGLACRLFFNIPPGTPDQTVTIDSAFIDPAELLFTLPSSFNFTPQMIKGTLTIGNPKPTINLSPTTFAFDANLGGANPSSQILTITNTGAGTLNWTATKSQTWLTLNPTSGSVSGSVNVSVNIAGLTANTYKDTIVVTDPNASNSPQKIPVTLVVTQPTIAVSPALFTFNATVGGGNPSPQTLTITNSGQGTLNWTASKLAAWLTLNPTSGSVSGSVSVSVNITGLTANTYKDTILVSDPNASNSPKKVPVTLVVTQPTIAVSPGLFTFNATVGGGNPSPQTLTITNSGQGTLNWTATKSQTWLTLNPTSGSVSGSVTVSVNIAGLTANTYKDTIVVTDPNASNSPKKVPVTLVVTQPTIAVSPALFTFNATVGGGNPSPQTLTITNSGQGTLNWTASKLAAWLTLNPTSGSVSGSVTVSVNIVGLTANTYNDTILVSDPNASNSPKKVPVTLIVAAEPKPSIFLSPAVFTFNATAGGANPSTQIMNISSVETGTLHWAATKSSLWLTLNPAAGTGDGPVTLAVSIAGLTAGTYADTIVVSDPNASNSPQKAIVTLNLAAQPKPTISVIPTILTFQGTDGDANPPSQTFAIINVGQGTLNWWAMKKKAAWLSFAPDSGIGNDTVTVNVDIAGLVPNTYVDTIDVNDSTSTNGRVNVMIILEVKPKIVLPDTVFVAHVNTLAGDQAVVDIEYKNYSKTSGLYLPLQFNGQHMKCDSVSFVGSRVAYMEEKVVSIDNDLWYIGIGAIPVSTPMLEPGSGLLARLYFTTDSLSPTMFAGIDSAFIPPMGEFYFADSLLEPKPTILGAGGVSITAVTEQPCFSFPTDTIHFVGQVDEMIPSISLPVANPCSGLLLWWATESADWLTVTPDSGSQGTLVKFQVNTAGLIPGSYITAVTFTSNASNSMVQIIVTLNLAGGGAIISLPDSVFDFGEVCRGDSVAGNFDLVNAGSGDLSWTATAPPGVLLSQYNGMAPSAINFFVSTGSMSLGYHEVQIEFTSPEAVNSPQTVTIMFSLIDCGQCSFDIAEVNVRPGLPVAVPIIANGIANIVGVEFHIGFNPNIVQADSITSDYLFNPLIGFTSGQVHYVWDSLPNPVTIPDGQPIVTLWFTAVGQVGETSPLVWLGNKEIVDPDGHVVNGLVFCDGSITIVPLGNDIAGKIVYYDFVKPVPEVTVELMGDLDDVDFTDQLGQYGFEDLLAGVYTIKPSRDDNDSGVTVADVLKIRRHIAYVEPFASPYQMVAADVNLSHTVSVADVIVIRRYLAVLDILASGNWAFVAESFPITMDNWYLAPRELTVHLTNFDLADSNFVGVRMGDVNNTWGAPVMYAKTLVGAPVNLAVQNSAGSLGQTVVVPVTVAQAPSMAGLELHLRYDPAVLTFAGVTSDMLSDMTINGVGGAVHVIWEDMGSPKTISSAQTVVTVSFIVTGHTSQASEIAIARAEVVNEIGDVYPLSLTNGLFLVGGPSALPDAYTLEQNIPNPFNPQTTIRATMPAPGEYSLTVYNIMGEKIREYRGSHEAGQLEFVWDGKNDAGLAQATGIYLYRFQAGTFVATRQMVLVK